MPIINTLLLDGACESPLSNIPAEPVSTVWHEDSVFKVYRLEPMLYDQSKQSELSTEYAVLRLAKESKATHICSIEGAYIGIRHVALRLKGFSHDLRQYLLEHRDPASLPEILRQTASGLQELHELGFVHRNMKPDNIVVNIDPLHVAIIDFNRALARGDETEYGTLGTPGYHPDAKCWSDTDVSWDCWALAIIILECDMRPNDLYRANSEKQVRKEAVKHIAHAETHDSMR